jgi:hypothetical protein
MIDGLWIVQYESVVGDSGCVVFVKGQVLGGDNGFTYTGTYTLSGDKIAARVWVKNFNPSIQSVLGIKGDYELAFNGTVEGRIIKASASLVNQSGPGMVAKLTKVTDLAA